MSASGGTEKDVGALRGWFQGRRSLAFTFWVTYFLPSRLGGALLGWFEPELESIGNLMGAGVGLLLFSAGGTMWIATWRSAIRRGGRWGAIARAYVGVEVVLCLLVMFAVLFVGGQPPAF